MLDLQKKLPPPCKAAARFVDVLGEHTALKLILELGGSEVFIGEQPRGRGMVETTIGYQSALALRAAMLEPSFRIPLATGWVAQCLYVQGMSKNAIARRLRVSDQTVRRIIQRMEVVDG